MGFVLPAAIDMAIFVGISKRSDTIISLYSIDFNEKFELDISDLTKSNCQWANFILGIVDQISKNDFKISGFNMLIGGDIPIGSGMSSSAALECTVVFGLNEIFGLNLSKLQMVKMAQSAEHEFAGVMCGIMDMFASMFGKENNLIKLDCQSLDYEYVPLELDNYSLVLINTNVKHNLAESAYNERRLQCLQGVKWVQEKYPELNSLRDVNEAQLADLVLPIDSLIYQRCQYVVSENARLIDACNDLQNNDLVAFGQKMFETHAGLSQDYEVSCTELDVLVDLVKGNPAVLGSRMMGGGFGGCTINIIETAKVDEIVNQVQQEYFSKTNIKAEHYIVKVGEGTRVV